jgi:poly(A) polymerase
MTAPETLTVMAALGEARFVGGVVRNALLGKPVSDIDIATPHEPRAVLQRLEAASIKAVPTGLEHGTITAIVGGKPFEVTSLRRDIATDGRRAVVSFTTDWALDAQRRDFTMNALYADAAGGVFDTVGGVADLKAGRVRFVGDPAQRIREDYLRILRLFRFHAWYGKGALDAAALAACEAEKSGLTRLSGERIAKEMLKLLEAENPAAVLTAMESAGILAELIPGPVNLARLQRLVGGDAAFGLAPDGVLRLAALLGPSQSEVAARWKLSNAHRDRLMDLAAVPETLAPDLPPRAVGKLLYALGAERFRDRVRLAAAGDGDWAAWHHLLKAADDWQRPVFPVGGADVLAAGVPKGPAVGEVLAAVENWWIDEGFPSNPVLLQNALHAAVEKVR